MAGPMLNFGRCRLEAAEAGATVEVAARALDVVLSSLVIDMLGLLTLDWKKLARWQGPTGGFDEPDYRQLERSAIRVFHPAVETRRRDAHDGALRWVTGWNALAASDVCFLGRVTSATGLDRIVASGRLGVIVGFQDSDHFRTVKDVEAFFELGQRVSQLTYNDDNRLGSGCYSRRDRGLTDYGAGVIYEMNRLGMAIDVSHCGERTGRQAIALSRQPVLVTHANCAALVPGQRRCRSDRLIREMAAKGGVMGITVLRPFIGHGNPSIENLLDHFDHVRKIAGPDHVGLGSDLDVAAHATRTPEARALYTVRGLDPVARVFQIADGLFRRGWGDGDVGLVLGGNFRRVLGQIWPSGSKQAAVRRDPFCPAPDIRAPRGIVARGG